MTKTLVRRPLRGSVLEPTDFLGNFDRIMSGFLQPMMAGTEGWVPPADLRETEKAYIIEAELPGVKKDEVDLTYEDGVLTFSGERRFESEEENRNFRRVERRYGSFSRSFRLPREVKAEEVEAHFEDGLLTITIPKGDEALPRTIKIN
jgi:HSP20 family protein